MAADTGQHRQAVLTHAMRRLTGMQRTVLMLRYYRGATSAEAAAMLGVSVSAVKMHHHRATRRLARDPAVQALHWPADAGG